MAAVFVHLRIHSEYSLIDGIVRIKPLVKAAVQNQMPALAITDHNNLFAAVKFYKAAVAAGIKPIIGVDLRVENANDTHKPYRLTLLCQNDAGYKNLTRLVSKAYLEGQTLNHVCIKRDWLRQLSSGLIALLGEDSDLGQAMLSENTQLKIDLLKEWQELFPNALYLELQRIGKPEEENYIQQTVKFAAQHAVPVVATNNVRFLDAEDFEAHEARVCIHDGHVLEDNRRPKLYTTQQYLRKPSEMVELFADLPAAIENTLIIAQRCNLRMQLGESYLPQFNVPNNLTIDHYLIQQAEIGLAERFTGQLKPFIDKKESYQQRLATELSVINSMGFAGYFLIVADFIQWSKKQGIPVGPGRGSGAGSLVAYALKITDIDPLPYDLLFERFLNPERISMPDFDIDFCMDGRDKVIEYVANHYGRESVSQIITYGSMAAKAVVRDVGRVLGFPYGFVDKIAKLIPFELGITLDKALQQEEELKRRYEEEDDVHTLIDLARKLEGITRNAGKHAGGVVIAPSVLTDFAPLYCESNGQNIVTQFDKDDVEAVGLVKFDFLGLRTLTIIDWAVRAINRPHSKHASAREVEGDSERRTAAYIEVREDSSTESTPKFPAEVEFRMRSNKHLQAKGGNELDISQIELNDQATFHLLKACTTSAVFQLESRGMKELIKRLQPDCFEDIIALVALFRPGPLQSGMVDDFINRKHGRAKVEFPHPDLAPILRPTYGIILYQEQVMQIAQVLAGYTLGGADLLRRAMGKKKPEEMAKQRAIFITGAEARGVNSETAHYIFDLMEKFAGYGFNKSHSAAYALLSYQTAWLKAHYPAEFMAAVLSSDMDNTDKVVFMLEECRSLGLTVTPPDIQQSEYAFSVIVHDHKPIILYGLGAIKGVGQSAIEHIILQRKEAGQFKDLFDFCRRLDLRKINRRVIESLIRAGAMDKLNTHRASLLASIDIALKAAEQYWGQQLSRQNDLFGALDPTASQQESYQYVMVEEWSDEQRLAAEKETLGVYLSGHPLNRFQAELSHFVSASLSEIQADNYGDQAVVLAGLIIALRKMITKRGRRMLIITLADATGQLEITLFAETYESYQAILVKDSVLVVEGRVNFDQYTGRYRMIAESLYNLEQARERFAKRLLITLDNVHGDDAFANNLMQICQPYRGGKCPIWIQYINHQASAHIALGEAWQVSPSEKLLNDLRIWLGGQYVRISYT